MFIIQSFQHGISCLNISYFNHITPSITLPCLFSIPPLFNNSQWILLCHLSTWIQCMSILLTIILFSSSSSPHTVPLLETWYMFMFIIMYALFIGIVLNLLINFGRIDILTTFNLLSKKWHVCHCRCSLFSLNVVSTVYSLIHLLGLFLKISYFGCKWLWKFNIKC
jgi:hypothetical protein